MIRIITLLITLFSVCFAFAQSGEIQGKVTDADSGEGIPFANVSLVVNGTTSGAQTDFDGLYSIKPLPPGSYDLKVSSLGYQTKQTTGIVVSADKVTELNVSLGTESELLEEIVIVEYKVPLIQQDETSTGSTVTKADIQNLSTRNVTSIASQTAGVYQADEGGDINVKGARSESTEYYVDGVKVRGTASVPVQSIEQISVLTGGVPAQYGDATGGIINITTRGPSEKLSGGIEVLSSQLTDAYNYNLLTGSIATPLFKKNKGLDSERALAGIFVAAEYLSEKDDDPSALGVWVAKDEVLQDLQNNPLVELPNGGFAKSTEFITMDDLENSKFKPNAGKVSIGGTAKIDIQPVVGLNFTLGANASYTDEDRWLDTYTTFNSGGNDQDLRQAYRAFARVTQRFGGNSTSKEESTSAFGNAFYSLQLDASKDFRTIQNRNHKDNLFAYGYVGKFEQNTEPAFNLQPIDALNGESFFAQTGYTDAGVTFTPGENNPYMAAHTAQYFALSEDKPDNTQSVLGIEAASGLINGSRTASLQSAYNIWYNPGRIANIRRTDENDQYRLTFNGSVDVKKPGASDRNRHEIKFGFEYEQRTDRRFDANPVGLWGVMRNRANSYIDLNFDTPYVLRDLSSPTLDVLNVSDQFNIDEILENGQLDTITAQSFIDLGGILDNSDLIVFNDVANGTPDVFASRIRELTGASTLEFVNTDAISPDDLSLDLFSADELFNGGSDEMINYYGYDYKGNKLSTQPAFEDFWTAKEDGINTRPIAAFRPIYTAAYIQDKFQLEDLFIRLGVRVDRFDANQKVLKDPYSLYGVRSVDEVNNLPNGDVVTHPANVDGDWAVYVDDALSPGNVVGYRNGDDWYTKDGEFVNDPAKLGANPLPYISISDPNVSNPKNYIKQDDFDVNTGFKDYEPQISLSPRFSFSFKMSEDAQFFAHYDQLAQRPQSRLITTASDYYFMQERSTLFLNNPNLRPEKTIDYQIGYKQVLTKSSSLTLSAFYRELKDMVQTRLYAFAYPTNYQSFDNRDFATIKGMEVTYDLRRTGNVRFYTTYTLSFAEGTGSDDASGQNLIALGAAGIRSIRPVNYDSRHNIIATLDYRYGSGKKYNGPVIGNLDLLSNFGVNLIARARSGEPYTRQSNATAEAIIGAASRTVLDGQINGSRLPWNTKFDLRVDKDFKLTKDLSFNVYGMVQNLFNQLNIAEVHSLTGNPTDDGYLSSNDGQIELNNAVSSQSFEDLYFIRVNDYEFYNRPRTIRIGASLNF